MSARSLPLLALALALCLCGVVGVFADPLPTTCQGKENKVPLVQFDASTAKLLATVANGTLESVLPSGTNTPILVLHVHGDSYSMGYAYGQLLADTLRETIPAAYAYFASEYNVDPSLVGPVLDMTCNATLPYTPKWHFEFLQGVSDGTGKTTSFQDLWRMAMIPEAIKASCSILGAWGPATKSGGLLHLRALDWGTTGPFQRWPLLATFHPNDGSFTHSTLGWVGLYGTITGYSSSNLALSEKVWLGHPGVDNAFGYPWTLMLQDILRFDPDVDAALARIGGATRTCGIWIGVGQGARPNPRAGEKRAEATLPADFKLVSSSYEQLNFYNPENFPTYPPAHPYFPSLLFVNKHVQPSKDTCFGDLMEWGYGSFEAEDIFHAVTALAKTGDMHIAVTDYDRKLVYVSNAAPMPNNSPAYQNGFVKFDMQAMWNKKVPTQARRIARQ